MHVPWEALRFPCQRCELTVPGRSPDPREALMSKRRLGRIPRGRCGFPLCYHHDDLMAFKWDLNGFNGFQWVKYLWLMMVNDMYIIMEVS